MSIATAHEWECTADEYHDDYSKIGHSMAETFRRSQREYREVYVDCIKPPAKLSEDVQLGVWAHTALFEPDVWASDFCCDLPAKASDGLDWNWRKPDHRKERDAFLSLYQNALDPTQRKIVEAIRDAVLSNPTARQFIEAPGVCEKSYWWTDADTGLKLKTKPDKQLHAPLLLDLKTCQNASPRGFSNSCEKFGYPGTAAWRIDGHKVAYGEDVGYLFIAVSKKNYSVGCYELDQEWIELGRQENRSNLRKLAACYESGDWLAEYEKGTLILPKPRWADSKSQDWETE
jgi:hypothetical protein